MLITSLGRLNFPLRAYRAHSRCSVWGCDHYRAFLNLMRPFGLYFSCSRTRYCLKLPRLARRRVVTPPQTNWNWNLNRTSRESDSNCVCLTRASVRILPVQRASLHHPSWLSKPSTWLPSRATATDSAPCECKIPSSVLPESDKRTRRRRYRNYAYAMPPSRARVPWWWDHCADGGSFEPCRWRFES